MKPMDHTSMREAMWTINPNVDATVRTHAGYPVSDKAVGSATDMSVPCHVSNLSERLGPSCLSLEMIRSLFCT
jgi:hypothetical protein